MFRWSVHSQNKQVHFKIPEGSWHFLYAWRLLLLIIFGSLVIYMKVGLEHELAPLSRLWKTPGLHLIILIQPNPRGKSLKGYLFQDATLIENRTQHLPVVRNNCHLIIVPLSFYPDKGRGRMQYADMFGIQRCTLHWISGSSFKRKKQSCPNQRGHWFCSVSPFIDSFALEKPRSYRYQTPF